MWAWYSRRRPWVRRLLVLGLLIGVAGGVLGFTPTPWYITAPGAAIDTSRMITVQGGKPHRDNLFMLIVQTEPANLFWYLYARLDRRAVLESPQEFLGPGIEDYQEYLEETRRMMADSQATAKAVAEQLLGYGKGAVPSGVEITNFLPDSPAAAVLKKGDVIVEAAGRPVRSRADLTAVLTATPAGKSVPVRVRRGGAEASLVVPTGEQTDPARKGQAAFGVYIADSLNFDVPIPVDIHAWEITGPSGGLMFTLQIIDQLTPGGITGGVPIAGTGTVQADGSVGPIGGVQQKVYTAETAGAKVMFVPRKNYQDAKQVATRIELVPVDRVQDALAWLKEHIRK